MSNVITETTTFSESYATKGNYLFIVEVGAGSVEIQLRTASGGYITLQQFIESGAVEAALPKSRLRVLIDGQASVEIL